MILSELFILFTVIYFLYMFLYFPKRMYTQFSECPTIVIGALNLLMLNFKDPTRWVTLPLDYREKTGSV